MECTIFLRNWHNIVLKSTSAVSLLNFINEGSNGEKGIHKMRESYDSLTHWAQIKAEGHVVVPILRGKSNLCYNWPITWTECTLRLKNWGNKAFKSLTLLMMARIRRRGHTRGENLISPLPWASCKDNRGQVVVPIPREGSRLQQLGLQVESWRMQVESGAEMCTFWELP
jgi:hypothetical protein